MLEGLDDIDWSKLGHAYGAADDVPQLLRDRGSDNPETADAAESELFGNINHQGTVYTATSYAVPFLVELLASTKTHGRESLVVLLAGIAKGSGYYQVHATLVRDGSVSRDKQIQARLHEEAEYVPRAHSAVAAHVETFVRLLDDPDKPMARQIPCLLAAIGAARDWLQEHALERASRERDMIVATNLVLALAIVVSGRSEWGARIRSARLPNYPMMRVAAAHAILACGDPRLMEEATEAAVDSLANAEKYKDYQGYYFGSSSPCELFNNMLGILPAAARPTVIKSVCRVLPTMDRIRSPMVASKLLLWAFDRDRLPSDAQDFTFEQRTILQQIDRFKNIVHADADYNFVFSHLQEAGMLTQLGIESRDRW